MPIKVSVVIPTFNRKNILKTTLDSFVGQSFSNFEVLVADDGSTDGTGDMVKQIKLPFPIKHLWHENAGRSAARNMGIKEAVGEIILFVDDHIILGPKFIEEHVKCHEKYKGRGVGAVRGYVEFIDDPKDAPPKPRYLNLYTRLLKTLEEGNPLRFFTHNVSVTKDALIKIGGFDEDFKEYGFQDQELGYRLKKAGYKIIVNPDAVGYIFRAVFNLEKECDKARQAGHSAVLCFKKHFWFGLNTGANPLNLLIYLILSANDNWWLRRAQTKLAKAAPKQKKKYQEQIKFFYFRLGVWEGFHPSREKD